ncbi:MAG: hypothetical protein IJ088_16230 [Clostridia bacterium]|nr:hypothetical protein [Clostridia bacterium]
MAKYLDLTGLGRVLSNLLGLLGDKVDKVEGKGLSTNDYNATDKALVDKLATADAAGGALLTTEQANKLAGIEANANNYTHPTHTAHESGLYKVTVDGSGHVSGAIEVVKSDITGLGIPAQDTTYNEATSSSAGLMSATDKSKLDGVATGANNYTLPAATQQDLGGVRVGSGLNVSDGTLSVPGMGAASSAAAGTAGLVPAAAAGDQAKFLRADGTWAEPTNTEYDAATSSAAGLMSATDKAKLDAFGNADTYALKSDITNVYRYKGSVATVSALPATGNTAGDVYDVQERGVNYAWTGTAWDPLGELFALDTITNAEIDGLFE